MKIMSVKKILALSAFFLTIFFALIFYFQNLPQHPLNPNEKAFVVIIPSYNNIQWYTQNLDSILSQEYGNFRVIFIDDASTDGMGTAVAKYLKEKRLTKRVHFIQNEKRIGALENLYHAIMSCDPHEII